MIPTLRPIAARLLAPLLLALAFADANATTLTPFEAMLRARTPPATDLATPATLAPPARPGGLLDPQRRAPARPGLSFPSTSTYGPDGATATGPVLNGISLQIRTINLSSGGDIEGNGATDWLRGEPFASSGPLVSNGHVTVYRRSPTGTTATDLHGSQSFANFGAAVASAGDVDGDGFDDILVGAPSQNGQRGAAYLYRGSGAGISGIAAWSLLGTQPMGFLGYALAGAGDVNADGYSDVLVAVPGQDGAAFAAGAVHCFHGGPSGLALTPAWTIEGEVSTELVGLAIAGNGDVNADGYSDVLVGGPGWDDGVPEQGRVRLFLGGPGGLSTTAAWDYTPGVSFSSAGKAVALPGDMDGDGYGEIAIGMGDASSLGSTNDGNLIVFGGSPFLFALAPRFEISSEDDFAYFGQSVTACGDLNGDGFADLAAGAPYFGATDEGLWFVLYGGTDFGVDPLWLVEPGPNFSRAGISLAGGGDSGDGRTDLLIGFQEYAAAAPAAAGSPPPFLYVSGGITLDAIGYTSTRAFAQGSGLETNFGQAMAYADVNGDGYSDVIAGGPNFGDAVTSGGRLVAYHGNAQGFFPILFFAPTPPDGTPGGVPSVTLPAWTYEGQNQFASIGWSVANAGDTNGDGYDDVIAGAPGANYGQNSEGAAYLFRGGPDGLEPLPSWRTEGNQVTALYGWAVAGAGDVNQDGFADVLVGAPQASSGPLSFNGSVSLYYGSALGLSTLPVHVFTGTLGNAYMGAGVAGAGDVDGDGFPDIALNEVGWGGGPGTLVGRFHLFRGGAAGVATTPYFTFGGDAEYGAGGYQIAPAGDVNGDGYADVLASGSRFAKPPATFNVAYVVYGSATVPAVGAPIVADATTGTPGYSLAMAGDLDNDGYGDIAIGSPAYSPIFAPTDPGRAAAGGVTPGRVTVHFGSALGADQTPRLTYTTVGGTSGLVGQGLAGGGDVNGDGWPDLAYSAPLGELGKLSDVGVLGVVYANVVRDGLARPYRMLRSDGFTPIAHGLRSDVPSFFRLGALARTPVGRGRVRLEWQAKPWGSAFDGIGIGSSGFLRTVVPIGGDGSAIPQNAVVGGLTLGQRYGFRVRTATHHPNFQRSRWFSPHANGLDQSDLRTAGPTGAVDVGDPSLAGGGVSFSGSTPNPLGAGGGPATLRFALPARGRVTIDAYDAGGRRVGRVLDADAAAGPGTATWDGRDDGGRALPRGLYFLRLLFGDTERTAKVVIAG